MKNITNRQNCGKYIKETKIIIIEFAYEIYFHRTSICETPFA